jgi:AcrR family transcriptional regulator
VTAPVRPRRADAVRNAERVLEAAREVFAERGLEAGVDEVAARAGVGKATVYRCWSTKEERVAAVAGARVDRFTAQILEVTEHPDPWLAFTELLRSAAASCARNALLYAGLTAVPESAALEAKRVTCRAALATLMDRAKVQGRMRGDVTAREVTVLLCGTLRTLSEQQESDLAVWSRYADLVVGSTRA